MGYLKRVLLSCLMCLIVFISTCSTKNTTSLPDACFVMPYPSVNQVDVACTGDLPNFSLFNFPHAPYVYELIVFECNFELVPKNSFQGLTGMQHLFLNCEDSKTVPKLQFEEGLFENLPRLSMIVIHDTMVRPLPSGLFCNLPGLTKLYFGNNHIVLPGMLGFGTNCSSSQCGSNVEVLKISENSIVHLPNHTFCTLKNLMFLDLSRNGLKTIEEDAFYNLESLASLDLSHNNLTSMPETVFKPLINLYSIDLANNPNLNISGFLKFVPHLKELYLPGIGLEFLDKGSFQGLHRVISLMLYDNKLQTIHEDIFEPFIGLADDAGNATDLQECAEDAIKRLVFGVDYSSIVEKHLYRKPNETGLQYLRLDGNNLTVMPPVRKLFTLFILAISKNQIEIVDDDSFTNLRQLQRLTLSFNRIQSISHRIFSNLKCLKHLLLDHNAISYVNNTAFHNLTALTELYLQHNRIKDIRGLFVKNENLNLLNLSHNLIEELSIEMLPSNIDSLDLSHNFIKHLLYSPGLLSKQLHMTLLDLSYNQIGAIAKNFFPISLINLLLNDNLITAIDNCTFCPLNVIVNVTLHNNQLQKIHPENLRLFTLPQAGKIPVVSLAGNNFTCNCELEEMRYFKYDQKYLHIQDMDYLFCRREYSKNKPNIIQIIQTIAPEDFLCEISHQGNDSLSEACVVFRDLNWKYIIGDCSGKNLTLIPSKVYPGVVKLYLDGNNFANLQNTVFRAQVHQNLTELYLNGSRIEVIEDNTFIELVKLTHLHLQNNKLRNLTMDSFAGLNQLIELRLSSNKLMVMDNNIFHPLSELRYLRLNNNQLRTFPIWEWNSESLSSISLSQNPWSCECVFVQDYREWLQNWASAVIDLNSLFCKFDNNSASGVPLIAFSVSHCFQQTEPGFLRSKHFPLLAGLITTLVLFMLSCLALYLYRKEMQVLIYSRYGVRIFHKNDAKRLDVEKKYDAFICYCNSDEDFVIDQLLPNLEGVEPPFHCCIHQRDFLVGGYITDNILEAVSKSRRSILVLSEAFIKSEWCRFEFKTAYVQMLNDKCNRVIVVVAGEIPKELDPEMQLYLKTNTYITWGDKLFWERLYFAMPDRTQTQKVTEDIQSA